MSNNVDYSIYNKPRKRKLEKFNQQFIKDKGGIVALTSTGVDPHYVAYKHILRKWSPFSIFEIDLEIARTISERVLLLGDKRLRVYPCDVCSVFYTSPKPRGKKHGVYRYFHLDFPTSGRILVRDYGLLQFLEKLAKWDNLKSPFYLETTFSVRGDRKFVTGENVGLEILEVEIPDIFERHGWVVDNPRNKAIPKNPWLTDSVIGRCDKYTVSYKDGNPMINGFHKFTRRVP